MKARKAFTLIELLVVISILVLLMAILLPTLRRARNQAKTVACRSNVRQWSLIVYQYTNENDGRLYRWDWSPAADPSYKELTRCPAKGQKKYGWHYYGGYDLNLWVNDADLVMTGGLPYDWYRLHWRNVHSAKSPGSVPVLLDAALGFGGEFPFATDSPPPDEDEICAMGGMAAFCTARHDGIVNALFMDWSVRRVGLKELWTLKWHREFDTRGPWTKAGGVLTDDWPAWMRGLKDY